MGKSRSSLTLLFAVQVSIFSDIAVTSAGLGRQGREKEFNENLFEHFGFAIWFDC
jgi:hypothetical protein